MLQARVWQEANECLISPFTVRRQHGSYTCLRLRSKPRAEQLCCIFQPRRFPHAEKRPPQRSPTKLTQMQRWEEQHGVQCQRDMAWHEAVVRPGSPVRGSRRLAQWWICWANSMLSGRPRLKPSTLATRSCKKRADTGDGQHVSVFTTLLRAKVTGWRMTELGPFMTLPCFGGMRRRREAHRHAPTFSGIGPLL